jgi:hypothetical protein
MSAEQSGILAVSIIMDPDFTDRNGTVEQHISKYDNAHNSNVSKNPGKRQSLQSQVAS